ncbi:helix-turn-helix domain-containing protein [Roseococcus sp. SDR]|uniref:hypothetical protein n=1 Tax=Roseococcus sp. SDR TaxID=2835532 RepID=UPI001BCC871E|nr:hypothetical protein [Roseococcus sp. SDR]MBS7790276.1 hypothetical protein [Roseococcus sp. SDR]MBV1845590.1 helix-turn-helix domain-containing protein [Roseococcus sp. SDR]
MRTFPDVIAIWPSASDLARELGVRDVTVRAWRQRGIPARFWPVVVKAAKRRKVKLTVDQLAGMASPRKAPVRNG